MLITEKLNLAQKTVQHVGKSYSHVVTEEYYKFSYKKMKVTLELNSELSHMGSSLKLMFCGEYF